MNKSELNKEIIAKISLEIEDSLFYMPGEKIKGKIKVNPGIKIDIKNNKLHFTLKLIQYESWDYLNTNINELKNIYKTEVQTRTIEYKLQEEEKPKNKEKSNFLTDSIVLIEKEEEEKILNIPFEFEIDAYNDKLLPTFQFETNQYFLGIRHLLIVEEKEYQSKNFLGLFIGKNKDNNYANAKEIEQNYQVGLGSLNIKFKIPKQSFYFGEQLDMMIKTDAKLLFKKITKIEQKLYRKIQWVGYLKNSLVEKKVYSDSKFKYNEDEYGIIGKLSLPFLPIFTGFSGGVLGTTLGCVAGGAAPESTLSKCIAAPLAGLASGSIGLVGGFFYGIYEQYKILKDIMKFNQPAKKIIENFSSKINEKNKDEEKCEKTKDNDEEIEDENGTEEKNKTEVNINKKDNDKIKQSKNDINNNKIYENESDKDNQYNIIIKEIKDNLKKFVYFKGEKIIGFIKFDENITPPVDGYYFNCHYNIKAEVHMSGMIINQDRAIKNRIDFYDGNDYIARMKKIFSVD